MTNETTISNQVVVLDKQTPEDVAKALIEGGRQKEPFYIFDMDEAYRRIEYFQKMMPRVQIFYGNVFTLFCSRSSYIIVFSLYFMKVTFSF